MAENDLMINFTETAVMFDEPLKDYTPDSIRQAMEMDNSDESIAMLMAAVSNKTAWLGHDIDDYEADEEAEALSIVSEYEVWNVLLSELYAQIIRRLESADITEQPDDIKNVKGLYYIIKPFKERYGYRDGAGWWIK